MMDDGNHVIVKVWAARLKVFTLDHSVHLCNTIFNVVQLACVGITKHHLNVKGNEKLVKRKQ